MNQKYLQGLASDMERPAEAVFFESTPENIAAFLSQHTMAVRAAIGTTDDRTFLTTRMGIIDICPDQEFLAKKLLPVYTAIQMGTAPVPPLQTVPEIEARMEPCPLPDWNYLRWEGYSDSKYQGIISGEKLLKLSWHGEIIPLEVQVRSYYSGGNLAILLADWTSGEPQPWGDLTVNLGWTVSKDCAFIDVNNLGNDILPWMEKNKLGKPTGRFEQSGFVTYPEYRFDPNRLLELDDLGYEQYTSLLKQREKRSRETQER